MWKDISVKQDDDSQVTLEDFLQGTTMTEKSIREALFRADLSPGDVASEATLEKLCASQRTSKTPRFVYRVCRDDQKEVISARGEITPRDHIDFSCQDLCSFFCAMWRHVRNGSRTHSTFISATSDFETAMHWSFCGLLPVIRIELNKLRTWFDVGLNNAQWLGGNDYNNLAANFAVASREYIIAGSIPGDAYALIRPQLKTRLRYLSLNPGVDAKLFPDDLSDVSTYRVRVYS